MPTDRDKKLEEIARTAIERANDTLHDLRGYDVLEYAAIEHEFTTALRKAYDLGRESAAHIVDRFNWQPREDYMAKTMCEEIAAAIRRGEE